MPENKDPIEQKSHVKLYVFAVGLLVFSTVWAVYDEAIGRRPWKSYQKQFLALADKKSQQDLKNAQAALTSEEYKALDQECQGVLKAFEEYPDRQAKVKELEEKDVEITELLHELQLHRGKYQFIVYIMEKLLEGEEKHKLLHEAQGLEPHIEQINAKIATVTAIEVLEHLDNPEKSLLEIYRVLKNKGQLIVIQDTDSLLFKLVWWFWTKWKGSVWNGSHINCYSPKKLIRLIKQTGFKVKQSKYTNFKMEIFIKAQKT